MPLKLFLKYWIGDILPNSFSWGEHYSNTKVRQIHNHNNKKLYVDIDVKKISVGYKILATWTGGVVKILLTLQVRNPEFKPQFHKKKKILAN
jgi:hypothetical protein